MKALIKKIISLALIITLSTTSLIILQNPIEVRAEEGNGEGKNDNTSLNKGSEGSPSFSKTGWLVYLVDTNGTLQSKVAFVSSTSRLPSTNHDPSLLITRIGNTGISSATTNAEWGSPFTNTGVGRGGIIKTEIAYGTNYSGGQSSNILYVIGKYLGADTLNKVKEEPEKYYLILETCAWHKIFTGSLAGYYAIASSSGWGKIEAASGMSEFGDGHTGWCDNFRLQRSCYLDQVWPGLPGVPTDLGSGISSRISCNLINQNFGYGMLAFRIKDDAIHTYWSPNGSPGDPEPPTPPKDGIYNIVKCYYTENKATGEKTADGTFATLNCCSSISVDNEEEEYRLESWATSGTLDTGATFETAPKSGPQSGTTAKLIKLSKEKGEKTVYVILKKIEDEEPEDMDYNYKLTETTITRRVWFSKPDFQLTMPKIHETDFIFESPAHKTECSGHSYFKENCDCGDTDEDEDNIGDHEEDICDGHTAYCTGWQWKEKAIRFSLLNTEKENYPDILATKEGWNFETYKEMLFKRYEPQYSWKISERQTTDGEIYTTNNWDYVCILMRGKDKLTLAKWINDGEGKPSSTEANTDLIDASSSGFNVGNVDMGDRMTHTYYEKFLALMDRDGDCDYETTYGPTTDSGHGICPDDIKEYTLGSTLSINVIVKVETYSGSQNDGKVNTDINTDDMMVLSSMDGFNTASGKMVKSGGTISFRPYVRMKYDTIAAEDLTAYVLGEYQRSMVPNDYAEIQWNRKDRANLTLSSHLWSTHAQPTKDWGTNNVLPLGAAHSLIIKKEDRQEVSVKTYQTVILDSPDKGRVHVDYNGEDGGLTVEAAKAYHSAYVESVVEGIDTTVVQQFVNSDPNADPFDGIEVNPGVELKGLDCSIAQTDDKYYMREDGFSSSGSDEGDYDTVYMKNGREVSYDEATTTTEYIFRSDTSGNILMNDSVILTKDQGVDSLSGTAKAINDRTLVVTKLVDAIERNTGNDSSEGVTWVSDGHWYNEAFDGVCVLVQDTRIGVGFISPTNRECILDPCLGPKSEGREDMWTKYYVSAYKTRNYSESYGKELVEGIFKDSLVMMKDLDRFYWTRPFWLSNYSVQDTY